MSQNLTHAVKMNPKTRLPRSEALVIVPLKKLLNLSVGVSCFIYTTEKTRLPPFPCFG